MDAETTKTIYKLLSKHCVNCHHDRWRRAARKGPSSRHAGRKLDASTIEQRIIDPTMVDPMAEMPAFGGKISPEDIKLLAAWLAKRK